MRLELQLLEEDLPKNKYIKPTKLKKDMAGKKVTKEHTEKVSKLVKNNTKAQLAESNVDVQTQMDALINGFSYFGLTYKYAQDIFTAQTLTIHQEKAKCKKAYTDNAFIQSGINYLINIIMGDCPGIESKNEIMEDYAKKWLQFSKFGREGRSGIKQALISGDGYIHKIKGTKNSFMYRNIENAEDMYIDIDYKTGRVKRYIERMYYTTANAKKLNLETFTLVTPYGTETINGISYTPDEIIHLKFMENIWGIYGRSPIAAILNDVDILLSMERAAAVISRYKAVPKKLIMPDINNSDDIMDDKAVMKVKELFDSVQDFESPVVGQKFTSLNMTDGGQAFDLSPYFEYFKRKASSVLNPEFIAHGELVNRSTSDDQAQLFYLAICSMRNDFNGDMNEAVHEGINASLNILKEKGIKIPKANYSWNWGRYDVELRVEKTNRMQKEWNDGIIKLDEYREEAGYSLDDDFGQLYKWETGAGASSEETLEAIQKLVGEKKKQEKHGKLSH